MKISLSLAWILLYLHFAYAQKAPMKWGKIPEGDLKMKIYEKDTTASAVVLGNYAKLDFDYSSEDTEMRFEHHKRIKILKRSGFNQGEISIPFYNEEKVNRIKAQVILPDGEKYDVGKENIFEEKLSDNWNHYRISFPNLKEGAIIEYKYQFTSTYFPELKEWYFQEEIPVLWSEYRLEIPEWYEYIMLPQGPDFDLYEQTSKLSNINSIKIRTYRMVKKNIPALKKDSYITTFDDYLMRIRFQLNTINYNGGRRESILGSWLDAAKELMAADYFGKPLGEKNSLKSFVQNIDPIVRDVENKQAKALAIYQYLSETMTWDKSYSYTFIEGIQTCFEHKKASSGELNLMFIALLNYYDIEATPVLLSTRTNGKMIDTYPILNQFNHAIAAIKINDQYQFFDVGSPFRPAGLLRINSCNSKAWIVDSEKPQWIAIKPPVNISAKLVSMDLKEGGQFVGKITTKINGYEAARTRAAIAKRGINTYFETRLKKQFPKILIDRVDIKGEKELHKDLETTVTCHLPEQAQVRDNFIYIKPILFPAFTKNPFQLEERTYPVDIPFPIKDRFVLILNLPKEYTVETLPEKLNLALPNKGGRFQFSANAIGTQLQISYNLQLNQLQFEPVEYKGLQRFFNLMLEKLEEQVVLKKVQ